MNTQKIIIELIDRNNGKWTWYQLERGLNQLGLGGQVNSSEELNKLVAEGFLEARVDERYPAPLYFVTELGRRFISR